MLLKKLKFFDLGLFKATETQCRTGRRRRVRKGVSLPGTISMPSDSNIFMLGMKKQKALTQEKLQVWPGVVRFIFCVNRFLSPFVCPEKGNGAGEESEAQVW